MGTALPLDTCESTREGVTIVELTFGTAGEFSWGEVGCKLKSMVGLGPDVGLKVAGSVAPSVVGLGCGVAAGGGVSAGPGNMALHRSSKQHPTRQSNDPVHNSEFR